MKVLAALATMAIIAAIGTADAQAAERTAKLDDPALSGQTHIARPGTLERMSLPARTGRTGLSGIEIDRIRSSIRDHFRAVTTRDAERLYETLTPIIKDYYRNSSAFLKILTTQLEPLANARDFSFSELQREASDAVQSVILTGPRGREWIARFRLQRQPDGVWAIMECQVDALQGSQT